MKKTTENNEEDLTLKDWYCTQGFKPPKDWDWKLIRKEWNKLKMPKDVAYDIFHGASVVIICLYQSVA